MAEKRKETSGNKRAAIGPAKRPATVARRRPGKVISTPLNRKYAMLIERRRKCPRGVKLREPEEEKEVKEERKSAYEVETIAAVPAGKGGEQANQVSKVSRTEGSLSDAKVAVINEILLGYLEQLPSEAIDEEFGY